MNERIIQMQMRLHRKNGQAERQTASRMKQAFNRAKYIERIRGINQRRFI